MKITLPYLVGVIVLFAASFVDAGDKAAMIQWSATDLSGAAIKVPAPDRPTVLLFVRAEQAQSMEALDDVQKVAANVPAQVILVFSGPQANEQAAALTQSKKYSWPIVLDPDFATSGKMSVHVWPTTLVVHSDGRQLAHLAGTPSSFPNDLSAYLEFGAGKLNDAALAQRLSAHEVIEDSPEQKANRHYQVARRLLEKGRIDAARAELDAAMKFKSDIPDLQLLTARVMILQNQSKEALALVAQVAPGAVPGWQTSLLKGFALVQMEQWEQARSTLPDAIKLNPEPSEAHYLLGQCYEHEKDYVKAAAEFRLAFEKSETGRKVVPIKP